jgi:hypothetical protein
VRYALLLYLDPVRAAATTPEQAERELSRYAEITEDLVRSGVLRGGEAFLPATMARFVTSPGARQEDVAVGGDDLELSGFYIVECDEDHALQIAARLPVVDHGVVEVRPLLDLPEPGASPDDLPGRSEA